MGQRHQEVPSLCACKMPGRTKYNTEQVITSLLEFSPTSPAWGLVCAVPALQELQPLLLQRVHQGAGQGAEAQAKRDQEDFKGQLQWQW